jgi:hypothetical protein
MGEGIPWRYRKPKREVHMPGWLFYDNPVVRTNKPVMVST